MRLAAFLLVSMVSQAMATDVPAMATRTDSGVEVELLDMGYEYGPVWERCEGVTDTDLTVTGNGKFILQTDREQGWLLGTYLTPSGPVLFQAHWRLEQMPDTGKSLLLWLLILGLGTALVMGVITIIEGALHH